MRISLIVAVLFLFTLPGFSWAQEGKRPLSLENIQYLLQERVSPGRVAALVDEHGVSFEATAEILEQLRNDAPELERAVTKASQRFVKPQRIEAEAEKRNAAAVMTKPGMVKIPAGEFWMGCNDKVDSSCRDDETPGGTVYVDAFQIDMTEVTVKAYRSCVKSGKCSSEGLTKYDSCNWNKQGRDDHPINCVTWDQALIYCEAQGKRLPTEAEWEKAARGEEGLTYPWGNKWEEGRANTSESGKGGTVAVRSYASDVSPYGIHDMAGNVWEWVQDWYDEDYYQKGSDRNPTGPANGKSSSVRGGSWRNNRRYARVALRRRLTPGYVFANIGFRCASS